MIYRIRESSSTMVPQSTLTHRQLLLPGYHVLDGSNLLTDRGHLTFKCQVLILRILRDFQPFLD